jgi:hypothetical protein
MKTLILLVTTSLPALVLAASGCTTQTVLPGNVVANGPVAMRDQPVPVAGVSHQQSPAARHQAPKDLVDPCSVRLEDIEGAMILYYVQHQRLPDSLEELRAAADITVELNFTCPESGKPYIYNPNGLAVPGGNGMRLVLYDATPAHNGYRWAVMASQNKQNQSFLNTFIVNLSEKDFSTYKQLPAPPPGDPQIQVEQRLPAAPQVPIDQTPAADPTPAADSQLQQDPTPFAQPPQP